MKENVIFQAFFNLDISNMYIVVESAWGIYQNTKYDAGLKKFDNLFIVHLPTEKV